MAGTVERAALYSGLLKMELYPAGRVAPGSLELATRNRISPHRYVSLVLKNPLLRLETLKTGIKCLNPSSLRIKNLGHEVIVQGLAP
jgi:hypothetical protein